MSVRNHHHDIDSEGGDRGVGGWFVPLLILLVIVGVGITLMSVGGGRTIAGDQPQQLSASSENAGGIAGNTAPASQEPQAHAAANSNGVSY